MGRGSDRGFVGIAIDPSKPVFMFSGQGSQKPGMADDLMSVPEVAEAFEAASEAFGFDVVGCLSTCTPEELAETRKAQAAITGLSVGIARALCARGIEPSAVLGFSLGQISALAVSGMLDDQATFALAAKRADLMDRASHTHPGAMCALLGADVAAVDDLCDRCAHDDVLVPANYNSPGQIVISGSMEAIVRAREAWSAQKKRSMLLATSGAFHSPLMQEAADGFAAYLESVTFADPCMPLICNLDAQPLDVSCVRDHLARHLVEPVRFDESVAMLAKSGATEFIEVGFGGVLTGLVKRIDKDLKRRTVQDAASFAELIG